MLVLVIGPRYLPLRLVARPPADPQTRTLRFRRVQSSLLIIDGDINTLLARHGSLGSVHAIHPAMVRHPSCRLLMRWGLQVFIRFEGGRQVLCVECTDRDLDRFPVVTYDAEAHCVQGQHMWSAGDTDIHIVNGSPLTFRMLVK